MGRLRLDSDGIWIPYAHDQNQRLRQAPASEKDSVQATHSLQKLLKTQVPDSNWPPLLALATFKMPAAGVLSITGHGKP